MDRFQYRTYLSLFVPGGENANGSLGPPAIGALFKTQLVWLVLGSPAKIETPEKSWYPYSNLSTGGPRFSGQIRWNVQPKLGSSQRIV